MPSIVGAQERAYCNKCGLWKPETDFSEFARDQHRREDENCLCLDCVGRLHCGRLARSEINGFVKEERERLTAHTRNPELEQMVGPGRLGKVMHSSELITRLHKAVPNLYIRPGNIEGDLSIYRIYGNQVDYVCYTNSGWLPEFSIVEFNDKKQPIHERRGWRTVLLRIIKFGLLTEEQAEKVFGRPSSPQQARFWAKRLWDLRNDRIIAKD